MPFLNSMGHIKDPDMMHEYFQAFKLLDVSPKIICEFGIDGGGCGGSFLLWNDFFAPDKIIGFDIAPINLLERFPGKHGKDYPFEMRYFDQMDAASLKKAADEYDYVTDLFIDDCGHIKSGIINTVYAFWPKLRSGGLYVIEDLHTASAETRDMLANIHSYFTDLLDAEIFAFKTIVVLRKK